MTIRSFVYKMRRELCIEEKEMPKSMGVLRTVFIPVKLDDWLRDETFNRRTTRNALMLKCLRMDIKAEAAMQAVARISPKKKK